MTNTIDKSSNDNNNYDDNELIDDLIIGTGYSTSYSGKINNSMIEDLVNIEFNYDNYQLLKSKETGDIYLQIGDFIIMPNEILDIADDILYDMPDNVCNSLFKKGLIPLEHIKKREMHKKKEQLASSKRNRTINMLEKSIPSRSKKTIKEWLDEGKKINTPKIPDIDIESDDLNCPNKYDNTNHIIRDHL